MDEAEMNQIKVMNSILSRELAESKDKIKKLEKEKQVIIVEYEKIIKEKEKENVAIKSSSNMNIEPPKKLIICTPEIDKLKIQNEGFKAEVREIKIEHAKILDENEKLKEKIVKLKLCQSSDEEELKDSKILNRQIHHENEVLKAEQTKIKDENRKLLQEIAKLKVWQLANDQKYPKNKKPNQLTKTSKIVKDTLNPADEVKKEINKTGKNPYKCDGCEEKFFQLSNLNDHYNTNHNKMRGMLVDQNDVQEATVSSSKENNVTDILEEPHNAIKKIKSVGDSKMLSKNCALCGYKHKGKNIHQASAYHLYCKHFKERFIEEFGQKLIQSSPKCPDDNCDYPYKKYRNGKKNELCFHYFRKHGIMKKYFEEAMLKIDHNNGQKSSNSVLLLKKSNKTLPIKTFLMNEKSSSKKSMIKVQPQQQSNLGISSKIFKTYSNTNKKINSNHVDVSGDQPDEIKVNAMVPFQVGGSSPYNTGINLLNIRNESQSLIMEVSSNDHIGKKEHKIGMGNKCINFGYQKYTFGPIYVDTEEECKLVMELVKFKISQRDYKDKNGGRKTNGVYASTEAIKAQSVLSQDIVRYLDQAFTRKGIRERNIGRKKRNYPKRSEIIKIDPKPMRNKIQN